MRCSATRSKPLWMSLAYLVLAGCAVSEATLLGYAGTALTVAGELSSLATLLTASPAAAEATAAVAILQKVVASLSGASAAEPGATRQQGYHEIVLAYRDMPASLRAGISAVSLADLQALDTIASSPQATDQQVEALGAALASLEPALRAQVSALKTAASRALPVETLP